MVHQIAEADNGQTIIVAIGDVIELDLLENPSTGYLWIIEEPVPFFTLQENSFRRNTEKGVGSWGHRIIKLVVEQSGIGKILLKKRKRWIRNMEETFTVHAQSLG